MSVAAERHTAHDPQARRGRGPSGGADAFDVEAREAQAAFERQSRIAAAIAAALAIALVVLALAVAPRALAAPPRAASAASPSVPCPPEYVKVD